jgi:hypothetical protein
MNKVNYNFLKTLSVIVLSVFLFANCEQSEKKNSIQEEQSENKKNSQDEQFETEFNLENLFFYSLEELQEKYGESNMQNEFIEACETCGPEGSPLDESYYTTTLFPNSNREVFIDWNFDKTLVTNVSVQSEGNKWSTKEGFHLGDSISRINRYFKNKYFEMFYFYEFTYNVNENYTLGFNAELDFSKTETETFQSSDSRLNKLVLERIELRLPGYSK